MGKALAMLLSLFLLVPATTWAADQADLMKKIDDLSQQLQQLKQQMADMQKKDAAKEERIGDVEKKTAAVEKKAEEATGGLPSWLELSGDFRTRFDYLNGKSADYFTPNPVNPFGLPPVLVPSQTFKNESLLTNRLGLNLKIKPMEDIQLKARLLMYKVWGHETSDPVTGANSFFADKQSVFDGNVGHTPSDNTLRVDQAYATWSNIAEAPVWFSVGRRPSTGGVPINLRMNKEKIGSAGVPGLLIDYAFDGATLGVAPDIAALPGFYAKLCYGKGFDSGFRSTVNTMKDVNFIGVNIVPYETDNLRFELQYSRGMDIFAFPEFSAVSFPGFGTINNTNLGSIDQFGAVISGKIDHLGPGDLNLFISPALSRTHPNSNSIGIPGMLEYGLMWDSVSGKNSRSGYAVYAGARYDIASSGTKIGLEYNHGSKNWITFTPASDDMWTSKLGTRGNVYEVYLIQEILKKPLSKYGKAFFRVGYQYYDFDYTGSNNWVGAPVKISDLTSTSYAPLMFTPLKKAHDIYATFDVQF
ncbi:MAG TPA: DUF3373 domain-containing protein [Dissulfurispiraceae bacterium]|nr:DUF3373 domain-containing protein [Dissulfurispiraceae bacterium]